MTEHSSPDSALLPCPFCGSEEIDAVGTLDFIGCRACGACFEGVKPSARELWNRRAPAQAAQTEPLAWLVPSDETGFCRIWWRDKERAEAWLAKHPTCTLVPLYSAPPQAAPESFLTVREEFENGKMDWRLIRVVPKQETIISRHGSDRKAAEDAYTSLSRPERSTGDDNAKA